MTGKQARWDMSTVADVSRLEMGQSPDGQATNTEGKGIPLIGGAADYKEGRIKASRYTTRATKVCRKGDLILCIRATIGKVAVADKPYCLGRGVAGLRPSKVTPDFLRYFLNSQANAMDEAGTGTTFRQIDKKTLSSWSIPLPERKEQDRIVAKLDSLLKYSKTAREELAHIPLLAERYKEAVLRAAYNEAQIAATRLTTLGALVEEVRNGVSRKPGNVPPGVPVLKISAVRSMAVRMGERRYYVPESGEDISRYALRPGDLLFTRYNGNPDLVANCGMVRELDEQLIYPDKLIRVRVNPQFAYPEFVEAVSAAPQARTALSPSIKSAAGQHGISGADLKRLPIPLPSRDQQHRIITQIRRCFSAVDGMTAESNRAASLLDRLDQATLAKAFRGELVTEGASLKSGSSYVAR